MRFLICGVLFCFLLFAVTGAGVRLPDARTRVGETPEIGRPMMQRSMAEGPAQAQLYMMTVARRADELERLRELAETGITPAAGEPEPVPPETASDRDGPKPAVAANPPPDATMPDAVMAEDAEAPVRSAPTEIARNDRLEESAVPQVAALERPSAEGGEPVPRLVNVPLPPPRPAFFGVHRRVHLHRRHRVIVVERSDATSQTAPVQPAPAQGAVVQGWPAQGAVTQGAATSATAAESGRRQ